jgi:hypothetical protein
MAQRCGIKKSPFLEEIDFEKIMLREHGVALPQKGGDKFSQVGV